VAPGCEEEVLAGINDVCGNVPVFGCSSSATEHDSGYAENWWQLHGSMAGWGTLTDGVVIAALWLFSNAGASCLMSHCYAPTQQKGKITRAASRVISEIDHQPAAQVLNAWMGGALDGKVAGGSVVREMAHFPLAFVHHGSMRMVRAMAVTENGKVRCFGEVACGDVRFIGLKAGDLVGAVAAVARSAIERAPFEPSGGILYMSASTACMIKDLQVLAGALPEELPQFFCCFTVGQQGMINGTACHGNLMVNIMLLG